MADNAMDVDVDTAPATDKTTDTKSTSTTTPTIPTPLRSVEGWIILLTNLHEEITEEDIQTLFGTYGKILNLHLNLDRRTGYVKGYALLEYGTREEATSAVEQGNGEEILGMKCKAGWCFVRGPEDGSGGKKGASGKKQVRRERSRSPDRR